MSKIMDKVPAKPLIHHKEVRKDAICLPWIPFNRDCLPTNSLWFDSCLGYETVCGCEHARSVGDLLVPHGQLQTLLNHFLQMYHIKGNPWTFNTHYICVNISAPAPITCSVCLLFTMWKYVRGPLAFLHWVSGPDFLWQLARQVKACSKDTSL